MSKVTQDNIGRFKITKELLSDSDMEVLLEIFKDIFVVKIVQDPLTPTLIYVAVSPMFREVEKGTTIPLYDVEITEEQLKTKIKYHITAKEVEEDQNDNWVYM